MFNKQYPCINETAVTAFSVIIELKIQFHFNIISRQIDSMFFTFLQIGCFTLVSSSSEEYNYHNSLFRFLFLMNQQ